MPTVEVFCQRCADRKYRIKGDQEPGLVSRVCFNGQGSFMTVGLRERAIARAAAAEHHGVYKEGHEPRIRRFGQALLL